MSKEGKVKKKFYKRWWFWVIVIIVVIAATNMGGGKDDNTSSKSSKGTTKTASAPVKDDSSSTKKAESTKKANKVYKIGDTVKVGKMTYKINNISTAKKVGPSVAQKTANGTYVVLDVTLKNNGDKSVTVDSSFFKLKHGKKTYEADAEASLSANQKEDGSIDNSFFAQDLNPDSTMSGKVAFDVAEDVANASDLKVQVQTGVFGTETQTINLK
ncbi:DUF4352 domain-containing protein [Heyndrickxia ginsengihumi]|uniref:DUF4352 domain-containing protein n=1 Tax=Heyndrickxia ginsengihumi TaxID=363870 RepID=UPI00046E8E5C|nr:DUF4352 domain-containing protein [Heyndrickxia ginsengihumi]